MDFIRGAKEWQRVTRQSKLLVSGYGALDLRSLSASQK